MRRAYFVLLHLCALGFLSLAVTAAKDYKQEILDADRTFDAAVAKAGTDGARAWAGYFAEDGGMNSVPAIRGREEVQKAMDPFFSKAGNTLRWQPDFADVAKSGDLGYTLGKSQRYFTDKEGKAFENEGRYITIWKRQKNGEWKIAFDGGTSTPPKPAAVRP
jgi:ketosteroid isomerase-like protein